MEPKNHGFQVRNLLFQGAPQGEDRPPPNHPSWNSKFRISSIQDDLIPKNLLIKVVKVGGWGMLIFI